MGKAEDILFFEPHFVPLIWGSESWAISAYKDASSTVKNGPFEGMGLRELWETHPELFGNLDVPEFPHLIKTIDANMDLSVQVHPDDDYAQKTEGEDYGKKECWYILDCEPGASIVIGHKTKSREEMQSCIDNNEWDKILNEFSIKPGDFFLIEPGTIHAIKGGTEILETQQTSDLTYRLYDYGRLENGKPRELHIKKALDVIDFSGKEIQKQNFAETSEFKTSMCKTDKFNVYLLNVNNKETLTQDGPFLNCSVISGEGTVDGRAIKTGDSFILPYEYGECEFDGNLKIIASHV